MSLPDDPVLGRVLGAFGLGPDALLGRGGDAWVYALDADRIVRVHHAGTSQTTVAGRPALLWELSQSAGRVPFAIPAALDTVVLEERIVTIERRLPRRPLSDLLGESSGEARASLVRAYLDSAARIGELVVDRPW